MMGADTRDVVPYLNRMIVILILLLSALILILLLVYDVRKIHETLLADLDIMIILIMIMILFNIGTNIIINI